METSPRQILELAVPALGALVAEPLFLLADTAIVSHLGTGPLAGYGTASAALSTLVNVCIFLAYGTTAIVSRRLGAGDEAGAMRAGIDGTGLAAGLGVLLAIPAIALAPRLVILLGAGPAAAGYATTYLRVSAFGLPAMLVVLAGTGLLRGLADTRTPLLIAVIAETVNVILNVFLVFVVRMGIAGSALGTVLAQTGMAICYLVIIRRAAVARRVRPVPEPSGMAASLGINVALLVRTVALRVYLLVAVWTAGQLGVLALAGYTVSANLWNLLALCLDALAIAAQTLTGHALGAGQPGRARALTARMVRWGAWYGVVTGVLLLAAAPLLLPLLAPDPRVRSLLGPVLVIMALLQPVAGVVFLLDGVLIGAGDAWYLSWAGLASTGVFVLLAVPVADLRLTVTWLWVAIAGLMAARLVTLGWRARGTAWLRTGGSLA